MINKLIPLVLVVGVLSACDGGAPPKTASVISNTTNTSATFPAAYASLPKKAGGTCAFDQPVIEGDTQFISGWAFISATDGVLAETVVLGITVNGSEKFAMTSKEKRDDVAKYFKNQAILDSGFSAYLNKVDVPSGSNVSVYQVFQGVVYRCEVTVGIRK